MKSIKYIIVIGLFFSLSCRKEIKIDIPNNERKIVLNTVISADSGFYAQVYRSSHAQDIATGMLYLDNATVEVYESNNLVEILALDGNGFYYGGTVSAEVGKTYEYRVDVSELASVSGKAQVLKEVPILSIDSIGVSKINGGSLDYLIYEINFEDEAAIADYYRLKVIMEDVEIPGDTVWYGEEEYEYYIEYTYNDYGSVSYEPIDPSVEVWPYYDGFTYFTDRLFDGESYSFEIAIPYYNETPVSFYLSLEHISFDFFRYVQSVDLQSDGEELSLFSQPVQVYINVENGFGIIGTSTASIDSVIYISEMPDGIDLK